MYLDVIKGIQHWENVKDSCVTKTEITKGGIGQKFATVLITTGRGCGINSVVTFFVDRPSNLKKEVIS